MPVRATADQATQRWVQGIGNATQKIQDGVARVQQAPGQKAAAAADKWLSRVQQSQAKWKANVGRVSLADWQQSMTSVGIARIAQGAQAKQGKFTAFMTEFLPYLQRGVQQIDAMPSTTLQDGIQRAVAMINYNAQFKRRGS